MWYTNENNIVTIDLYVQPGSKCTGVVGLHGDAIKIRIASPPLDGCANAALLKYISKLFEVPLRQVKLLRGDKSRHKSEDFCQKTIALKKSYYGIEFRNLCCNAKIWFKLKAPLHLS